MPAALDSGKPVETVQIQARGLIRILSKQIKERLDLKEGDFLQVSVDELGRIILEPVDLVPRSERYLHSPAWRRRLAESAEDRAAGRVQRVDSSDRLMAEIDEAGDDVGT